MCALLQTSENAKLLTKYEEALEGLLQTARPCQYLAIKPNTPAPSPKNSKPEWGISEDQVFNLANEQTNE